MKLKDFQVGQTVYLIERRPKPKDVIREYKVSSIGRKYLNVQSGYNERKFIVHDNETSYLIEHKEFGDRLLLFPNKEAAQEHIEGNQLRSWLLKAAEVPKVNKYTVEQLRPVKEILEPNILTKE